ncbi:MAG: SpoIIE family protein phosphatase [Kineosporiaceae bacterium]
MDPSAEHAARVEAEQLSRRLTDLYALTTRLAAAGSTTEVATAIIEVCLPMLEASAATITVYDSIRPPRLLATFGVAGVEDILFGGSDPEDRVGAQAYAALSVVKTLVAERRPILVTSVADREQRFPDLIADGVTQEAWANLPLVVGERLVGILAFGWDAARTFDEADVGFLMSIAAHSAIALDRALSLQAADSAVTRLRRLQEVTAGLATAATVEAIAGVLVELGVCMVAPFGVVAVLDREARVWRRHASTSMPASVVEQFGVVPVGLSNLTPLTTCAETGRTLIFENVDEIVARFPAVAASYLSTGSKSHLCVPIMIGERSVGALGFGFERPGPISDDHLLFARTLASLAGPALERAALYEAEYRTAHHLQAALLPDLSVGLPGGRAGGCYVPGTSGREIGGDWYDVFETPGNRIGLCVGDVVGHDLAATTVMMKLQPLLRSLAQAGAGPAQVLEALDAACDRIPGALCSTVGYADYSATLGLLRISSAGHPPALLLTAGRAEFLEVPPGPPLGVAVAPRRDHEFVLPDGAMVVWYSDGLIERRDRSLGQGLAELLDAAAEIAREEAFSCLAPHVVAERLRDRLGADGPGTDDLAVLCLVLRRQEEEAGAVFRTTLSTVAEISGLRDRVRRWAERANLRPDTIDGLIQVTNEIATNALEHPWDARDPRAELTIDKVDVDRVRVQAVDHGRWRTTGDSSERGRGLTIISELAQNTTIELRPDGTHVTAVLRDADVPDDAPRRRPT